MVDNLENKINETLPAIRQDNELAKLANEASFIEHGINGFVCGYLGYALFLNFGDLCTLLDRDQRKRTDINTPINPANVIGMGLGLASWLKTEFFIFAASTYMFGSFGVVAYLGTKAITNYLGYKYYKNQRKKHAELKKIYLLEKNDK